jgi:hypothetical protein
LLVIYELLIFYEATKGLLVGMGDPQPDMGIPAVSYCYYRNGSGESVPDGDLPIAIYVHNQPTNQPVQPCENNQTHHQGKFLLPVRACLVGKNFGETLL